MRLERLLIEEDDGIVSLTGEIADVYGLIALAGVGLGEMAGEYRKAGAEPLACYAEEQMAYIEEVTEFLSERELAHTQEAAEDAQHDD